MCVLDCLRVWVLVRVEDIDDAGNRSRGVGNGARCEINQMMKQ